MRGAESRSYSIFLRSVWQMPQLSTRISNSPGPISGVGRDSTVTWLLPWYTAAFIIAGVGPAASFACSETAVCKKLSQTSCCQFAIPLQAKQLWDLLSWTQNHLSK